LLFAVFELVLLMIFQRNLVVHYCAFYAISDGAFHYNAYLAWLPE